MLIRALSFIASPWGRADIGGTIDNVPDAVAAVWIADGAAEAYSHDQAESDAAVVTAQAARIADLERALAEARAETPATIPEPLAPVKPRGKAS